MTETQQWAPFYTGLRPGQKVSSQEEMDALPNGTWLTSTSSNTIRRMKGGQWSSYGQHLNPTFEQITQNGEVWVVDHIQRAMPETVEQFHQRFRDVVFYGEQTHFGSDNYSETALADLGIEFKPSVGMRVRNAHDVALLPVGTRVFVGHPDHPDSFGLYEKTGENRRSWTHLFGGAGVNPWENPVTIDALPEGDTVVTEPAEWFTKPATPEDGEALFAARKAAWERGYRSKKDHNWCTTYESVVRQAGLTADSVQVPMPYGMEPGDVIASAEAVYLPLDAVLIGFRGRTHAEIEAYRRITGASNRAGVEKIITTRRGLASQMMITGDTWLNGLLRQCREVEAIMPVYFSAMLDNLPIGSQIKSMSRYGDRVALEESSVFEKRSDTWSWRDPNTGSYQYTYRPPDFVPPEANPLETNYAITRIGA
jgi:hypothetical protein